MDGGPESTAISAINKHMSHHMDKLCRIIIIMILINETIGWYHDACSSKCYHNSSNVLPC